MKKLTGILSFILLAASTYAQDSSSSSMPSTGQSRDKDGNNNWQNNAGTNRWSDTAYYRRNRSTYDSLLRINRSRWNEDSSYFVHGPGDTMRQYRRSDWMRDSINFENRNWDSSWQNNNRWGDENNTNNAQPGQYKGGQSQPGDSSLRSRTGNMNGNHMDSSMNSASGQSSATQNKMEMDSASSNRAGRTTDRKTTEESTQANSNTPALSGAGDTQSTTKSPGKSTASKDRVYMKNNQLMVSKNGTTTKVNKSITLKDGTVILANGTVKMPDGSSMKLKNGESISLNQKPAGTSKQQNQ